MSRLCVLVILAALLLASTATAGTQMRVVRHDGYDSWRKLEARLDRSEAATDLIRARTRSIDVDVQIKSEHLEAYRDARSPQGVRTLGRVCIYGPNDEVIYRPRGRNCSREPAQTE